jgi:MFS family permease
MSTTTSIIDEPKPVDTPHSEESPSAETTEQFHPGWRFILAFLSLTTVTLMVALDATSLSVALPIMAKLLNGTAIEAFWSGTSFLLTSTVFQPVLGSFSNIFGRLPMVWLSLVLFGIGAIVAAVANNFTVILVGRSIQGIGGGGIITLTEIIVTDMVPLRLRGQWFSFISSAWAIGEYLIMYNKILLTMNRDCIRPSSRRWIFPECFLALDLLDQSPFHRRRGFTYRLVLTSQL